MRTRHFDRMGNGGLTFTELGFGSASFGNLYRAITDEEADALFAAAWEMGCRYFDTAPLYGLGLAETRLNHFLRNKPRNEFIVSTKVGRLLKACASEERTGIGKFFDTPSRKEVYDYSYDGVMRSLDFSLERLGLDRVDILYVHDLDIFTHGSQTAADARIEEFMRSGYDAMIKLRDHGVVKAIGAGINEWRPAQTLAQRGDFDLFLLAGRYTLLEQESLESFLPLCEKRGIGLVIGGVYNSGLLASGPKPGAFYNYNPAPQDILDRVALIEAVCTRHSVKLIEAALKFPLMHKAVVSLILGSQTAAEAKSNLAIYRTDVPPALWAELKAQGLMRVDAPTA